MELSFFCKTGWSDALHSMCKQRHPGSVDSSRLISSSPPFHRVLLPPMKLCVHLPKSVPLVLKLYMTVVLTKLGNLKKYCVSCTYVVSTLFKCCISQWNVRGKCLWTHVPRFGASKFRKILILKCFHNLLLLYTCNSILHFVTGLAEV